MPSECLNGLATPNIPQFRGRIAGAGDEDVLIGPEGQTKLFGISRFVWGRTLSGYAPHNVPSVITKFHYTDPRFDIP